jgi:serine/threonine-protein kinase RsbW
MASERQIIRLVLPANPANVSLVRHTVAGLAEAIGMDEDGVADVKAVVTEACVNAVVHAYDDEVGPVEVLAGLGDGAFEIIVRDFGLGFRPRVAAAGAEQSLRLGLPLIATLASSFELRGNPGGGTELRIALALPSAETAGGEDRPPERVAETREDTVVSIGDHDLAALLVSRVLSSVGARAELSIDKLSDAVLLGDAIAGGSPDGFVDGRVQIAVTDGPRSIVVKVGPLREGAAEQLLGALEVPALGASLQKLADEVRVETAAGGEHLMFRISERPPGG